MLLVQTVPDDIVRNRQMIESAVDAYLRSGGRIQRVGATPAADTAEFNGAKRNDKSGRRSAAELDARIRANLRGLIQQHRKGAPLSTLAREHKTSVPTIKRHLFDAGEDPHANIKNPTVSYGQLQVIQSMTGGGAPVADIAEWAGLPPETVRTIIRDFRFKRTT